MRKHMVARILILATGILLGGCGLMDGDGLWEAGVDENSLTESQRDVPEAGNMRPEQETVAEAVQGGPYGEIAIPIPDGWNYELCPIDSDKLIYGMYGIRFKPEGVADGHVAIAYIDSFGVCGTGLKEEEEMVAGIPAYIGTYDNHEYWDYIAFKEEYKGIVALTYSVDSWWSDYSDQVMDILDMLSFDQSVREGGAYVYSSESEIREIGLYFSLKNISPSGTTLVLQQYDAGISKGELISMLPAWEKSAIINIWCREGHKEEGEVSSCRIM